MKKVLILFAHPALQRSRVNTHLLKRSNEIEGVTLHDLYEHYPDLQIDIGEEQALLLAHDHIIMQHPFYWYSTPSILKEWQDLVLQHGWAYGHEGHQLEGKTLFNAVTTGGPESAYQSSGYNHFTLRELLAPLEQTANLCRMIYLPPFAIHGTHRMETETLEAHVSRWGSFLQALVQEKLDPEKVQACQNLNRPLEELLKGGTNVR